uniref:Secreted protein n=1 Tax=Heterorhabditis bacteriophora TaxID=37862 RepID=A0A1I7X0Y4_HETBA
MLFKNNTLCYTINKFIHWRLNKCARMAEWSKAPDSSASFPCVKWLRVLVPVWIIPSFFASLYVSGTETSKMDYLFCLRFRRSLARLVSYVIPKAEKEKAAALTQVIQRNEADQYFTTYSQMWNTRA